MTTTTRPFRSITPARPARGRTARVARALLPAAIAALALGGCTLPTSRTMPSTLHAPYPDVEVWAVAPFANESGTSIVDSWRIADMVAQATADVDGVHVMPVNRVIQAMQAIELREVVTAADARLLASALGVDALLVGTVTAYDPYPPLTLGLAVELHRRDDEGWGNRVDPASLTRTPSGPESGSMSPSQPIALASGVLQADNQRVRAWLDEYAAGRSDDESAFGADIHLVQMDRYVQFVGHVMLSRLLQQESDRLRGNDPAPADPMLVAGG